MITLNHVQNNTQFYCFGCLLTWTTQLKVVHPKISLVDNKGACDIVLHVCKYMGYKIGL